jgi:DNA-binding GntR family transcriptional regulator
LNSEFRMLYSEFGIQNAIVRAIPHMGTALRTLPQQTTLVDQVYDAILSEISAGRFGPDRRLIQEELAASLGVSRQPVQQALLLLRSHGLLRDAPGRGLMVAPLDADFVRNLYDVRGALDGLAAEKAAERAAAAAQRDGAAYLAAGRDAVASGDIPRMIATDMEFHFFLYGLSANPLIADASATHWKHLRRVMGEVLLIGETPGQIWDQHEAILQAIAAGDTAAAGRLAREHIAEASVTLTARLDERTAASGDPPPPTRPRADARSPADRRAAEAAASTRKPRSTQP